MTQVIDPRSPWVFDTRELGRRAGNQRQIERSVAVTEAIGLELMKVPAGASVAIVARAESVIEGVLITGEVVATAEGECARCLQPVTDKIDAEICELFAYADSATDETTDSDEVHRLTGDLIDLEPVARDAIVLALPVTPHCREDCRGLCAVCGERLDDLPADHKHDVVDERWAALRQLFDENPGERQGQPEE